MVTAPTSFGKTTAFLLPVVNLIQEMKKQNKLLHNNSMFPIALIILPTRELCYQLYNYAQMIANSMLKKFTKKL